MAGHAYKSAVQELDNIVSRDLVSLVPLSLPLSPSPAVRRPPFVGIQYLSASATNNHHHSTRSIDQKLIIRIQTNRTRHSEQPFLNQSENYAPISQL